MKQALAFRNILILSCLYLLLHGCSQFGDAQKTNVLLQIDTSKVEKWEVNFKGKNKSSYSVIKVNGVWKVQLGSQQVAADTGYIRRSLLHMSNLRADSSFQSSKSDWDKFGVGDTGTEVRIYSAVQPEKRLIIGSMDFFGTSKAHFYVRIPENESIYVVDKYLSGSLAASEYNIRSKKIINADPQNIFAIHILAANGSPVDLNAEQTGWTVNSKKAEIKQVGEYVKLLTQLKPTDFKKRPAKGADYSIIINGRNGIESVLKFYRVDNGYVMESSANEGNFMFIPPLQFGLLFPSEEYFLMK